MKIKRSYALLSLCLLSSCHQNISSSIEEDLSGSESLTGNVSSTLESSETRQDNQQRVVIIGIDGAGHNFNKSNTPHIMEIFKDYAYTEEALSANPTISAQSWGSLLTGVIPTIHQFTNTSIREKQNQIYQQYPSIFMKTRQYYPEAELASFCNWEPINHGIVESHIDVYKEHSSNDDDLAEKIIYYLEEKDPKLLFVQFDSVDEAGHEYGYQSEEYFAALKNLDFNINAIFNKLEKLQRLENTLFIVTTDHGGLNQSHGGYSDYEKYIFFGARNKNILKTDNLQNLYIRDIPSIVAHHLGFEADSAWDSYIPKNLFKDLPEGQQRFISLPEKEVATPNAYEDKGLYQYFDKKDIALWLNFDEKFEDQTENYKVISHGVNLYEQGITGKAIQVSNKNYLTIEDFQFQNNDFTLSTFVSFDSSYGDPCLFSNKDWANGYNDGICFSLRDNDMKLNLGKDKESRWDAMLHYPHSNYKNSWMHLLISYNAKENSISLYVNFSLEYTCKMDKYLSFDGNFPFNIGQDGTGIYALDISMLLDDFMIFNQSLNQSDVYTLKSYYKNCL